MERLSQHDLQSILTFLQGCYAIQDFETFVNQILCALPQVIPADFVTYNEMWPTLGQSNNWLNPAELNTSAREQIWVQHMHEHPVLTHAQHTSNGQALKITDFLSRHAYHRLGLFNELYRPIGFDDWLGISIPTPASPPLVLGISLMRSTSDFTEQERLLLSLLRPHLMQAHKNAVVFSQLQHALAQATQTFEHLDYGVLILSADGRVRLTNAPARQCIEAYFGDAGHRTDDMPEVLQQWVRHQQAHLCCQDDAPPPRTPFTVERDGKWLVVRLLTGAAESLLLFEEETLTRPLASATLSHLTPREREVLGWVRQGKTNAEVATLLSIRLRTVKKHLEHIYQKLGVENRTMAAAWVRDALDGDD